MLLTTEDTEQRTTSFVKVPDPSIAGISKTNVLLTRFQKAQSPYQSPEREGGSILQFRGGSRTILGTVQECMNPCSQFMDRWYSFHSVREVQPC